MFANFEVVASAECQTQGLSFVAMGVNIALDVVTDCLSIAIPCPGLDVTIVPPQIVVSIPFLILRRVRISTQPKVALSAVSLLVTSP